MKQFNAFGHEFENEFFGTTIVRSSTPPPRCEEHVAIREAKAAQSRFNWHPANPSTPLARRFFFTVRRKLPPDFQDNLQLFCAGNTALDWWWGTDMFLSIELPGEGEVTITVDLTTRKHKEDIKPDFVLTKRQIQDDGELNTLAERIATVITNRRRRL